MYRIVGDSAAKFRWIIPESMYKIYNQLMAFITKMVISCLKLSLDRVIFCTWYEILCCNTLVIIQVTKPKENLMHLYNQKEIYIWWYVSGMLLED